jgi:hypothetical protein
MSDLLTHLHKEFKPSSTVEECFSSKNASSVEGIMQYFDNSFNSASQVSGDMYSSPSPSETPGFIMKSDKRDPRDYCNELFELPESPQEAVPVRNARETVTENLDPMRYVDLQLEVLRQLSGKNDRYLDSIAYDPRYKPIRDAAEQIRRQDRDTYRQAERNVKDALDQEARFAGMSGERVSARYGDDNYKRQEMIADRYKQLSDFRRNFR